MAIVKAEVPTWLGTLPRILLTGDTATKRVERILLQRVLQESLKILGMGGWRIPLLTRIVPSVLAPRPPARVALACCVCVHPFFFLGFFLLFPIPQNPQVGCLSLSRLP